MLEYINLHPVSVSVGICFTKQSFNREMKRLRVDSPPSWLIGTFPACVHTFDFDGEVVAIMCLDVAATRSVMPIQVAAILAHEAVHVMQACRDWMLEKVAGRE